MEGELVTVTANFVCYRFRRYERIREYVGGYRFILRCAGDAFRIKERRVLIDAHELGIARLGEFYSVTRCICHAREERASSKRRLMQLKREPQTKAFGYWIARFRGR